MTSDEVPRMMPQIDGIMLGMRVRLKRGQTNKVGRVRALALYRDRTAQAHVVWEERGKGQHMSAWVALGNLRPVDAGEE